MSGNQQETKSEIRGRVKDQIMADAVSVDENGDDTIVKLLFHEPSSEKDIIQTPLGLAIEVHQPNVEALIAEVMDDVSHVTTPDEMEVHDRNGFYEVEVTFEDGKTW